MSEASKYSVTNNQSNVSFENQGNNPQTINIQSENISLALQDLKKEIEELGNTPSKEIAEANFELLKMYIETQNKDKASGVLEKLKNTLGNVSSLITIGTFLVTL